MRTLPVAAEDVERAAGDGFLDGGLQQLEDLEAEGVVSLLALVQEMADVEEDQAVDVGLFREMPLEALQPVDEDERVAIRDQLPQGAACARAPTAASPVSQRSQPKTPR